MLERQLGHLEGVGLVQVAKVEPELEYLFRHALVQDAAYETLLKADRKLLHGLVASVLEDSPEGQSGRLAATLAHHFERAEKWDKALAYYTRAGERSFAQYALAEALGHTSQAINIGREHGSTSGEMAGLYLRRGRILELTALHAEAEENYMTMETFAREENDGQTELDALVARMTLYSTITSQYDPDKATTLADRALNMAQHLGDPAAEARILWNLCLLFYFTNDIQAAVEQGERSVALAREHNLREQLAYSLQDMARPYMAMGWIDRARAVLSEAIPLWRELQNQPMLSDALATLSSVTMISGNLAEAETLGEEGLAIAWQIDNKWGIGYTQTRLTLLHFERGNLGAALTASEDSVMAGIGADVIYAKTMGRTEWAWQLVSLGSMTAGVERIDAALSVLETEDVPPALLACVLGVAARAAVTQGNLSEADRLLHQAQQHYKAKQVAAMCQLTQVPRAAIELALARGEFDQAVSVASDTVEWMREVGMRFYLPNMLYLQAQSLVALEHEEEALAVLQEARAEAQAQGVRLMLWRIMLTLDELQPGEGHGETAQNLLSELVASLADNPEIQADFARDPNALKHFC